MYISLSRSIGSTRGGESDFESGSGGRRGKRGEGLCDGRQLWLVGASMECNLELCCGAFKKLSYKIHLKSNVN